MSRVTGKGAALELSQLKSLCRAGQDPDWVGLGGLIGPRCPPVQTPVRPPYGPALAHQTGTVSSRILGWTSPPP